MSYLKHNKDAEFYIILADKKPEFIKDESIVEVENIGIIAEVFSTLLKEYNIIEFNTAIKPFAFDFLVKSRKPNNIVYLDPDILVYQSFDKLFNELEGNNFMLTPHILNPIKNKAIYHLLLATINTGTYNLGFLGLNINETTIGFIEWWKSHLTHYGHNRILEGQFYDQKVMNLVPAFYEKVLITRNSGRNIAEWNFHERSLSKKDEKYYVNSDLLEFFHFSGVKITSYEDNLGLNKLIRLADSVELKVLIENYISENKLNHYEKLRTIPCAYQLQPNIHRASKKEVYIYKIKKWLSSKK
ncbi:glycosyltransferase family protein [Brumimicrobium oceani]|nr:hypothetical protein [Brumimicrobium oceani]